MKGLKKHSFTKKKIDYDKYYLYGYTCKKSSLIIFELQLSL